MGNGSGALRIGQLIGRYRIDGLLGVGGMGAVYRATDGMLQRTVAIKVPERTDADSRRSLLEEARLAASLSHPSICGVHAIGSDGDQPFIVMEHVSGVPLAVLIGPGRALPFEVALRYFEQIVNAVAHAHARGVVHCDLKSSNIMIAPGGAVKILDFGLAFRQPLDPASHDGEFETTRSARRSGAGTVPYMAPEVLRGYTPDARADIWALGILAYEMLSGARPFNGATRFEVAAAILNDPPSRLPARVPRAAARLMVRCLEKDPGNRFPSARELAAALRDVA